MKMPGLPKVPAAEKIDVDENGVISGLFQTLLLTLKYLHKYNDYSVKLVLPCDSYNNKSNFIIIE